MLQRYSFQEAINRILRVFKGNIPTDDQPNTLSGGMHSWDEAFSYLAELFQGSYPDVTGTFPQYFQISSGSFAHAHTLMHLWGIGIQRLGNAASHVLINPDGTVMLIGDAASFTDFSVPATLVKQGANNKPDFDYTNLGLLFPQNDSSEGAYLVAQFPHDKKLNSVIYPHVHYIQTSTGTPVFTYSYRWYNNGGHVPAVWNTGTTAQGNRAIFTYTSGSMLQIGSFPAVTPPMENERISSNFEMVLWRSDTVVAGDVLVKYVDIHIEKDGFGSSEEYTK